MGEAAVRGLTKERPNRDTQTERCFGKQERQRHDLSQAHCAVSEERFLAEYTAQQSFNFLPPSASSFLAQTWPLCPGRRCSLQSLNPSGSARTLGEKAHYTRACDLSSCLCPSRSLCLSHLSPLSSLLSSCLSSTFSHVLCSLFFSSLCSAFRPHSPLARCSCVLLCDTNELFPHRRIQAPLSKTC